MRRSAFWEASYWWNLQWSLQSIQWCSSDCIKAKLNTTRGRTCFGPGRLFCVGIKLVWATVRIPDMGQWVSCSRIMHTTYPLIIKHWNYALPKLENGHFHCRYSRLCLLHGFCDVFCFFDSCRGPLRTDIC